MRGGSWGRQTPEPLLCVCMLPRLCMHPSPLGGQRWGVGRYPGWESGQVACVLQSWGVPCESTALWEGFLHKSFLKCWLDVSIVSGEPFLLLTRRYWIGSSLMETQKEYASFLCPTRELYMRTHRHDFFPCMQAGTLPALQKYKTLEAMLPLLMLLLLSFLPVLIKLGNPLSRQKRGERCFIIKEEGVTPANVAPLNEKYRRVLQDLEISITQHTSVSPLCEEDNTTAPPLSHCSFLIGKADYRCCLRDKCSSTAFGFSCCPESSAFLSCFIAGTTKVWPAKVWRAWALKTASSNTAKGLY